MKELVEFRIDERKAAKYLRPTDGVHLGTSVRKILLPATDELVTKILMIHKKLKESGDRLFVFSHVHRRYTENEMRAANAFKVIIKHYFEPAGEECGTVYDESSACKYCGASGLQVSDLILETRSLPKPDKIGIAKTIAGEIVVSQNFVDLFKANKVKGAEFRAVRQRRDPGQPVPGWYQLLVTSKSLNIVAPTLVGVSPFDDGSEPPPNGEEIFDRLGLVGSWCDRISQHRCPLGDTIGLNLISELWLQREEVGEWDVAWTKQKIGVRRGELRPESLLVFSSRLRDLVLHQKLKGMGFEPVHFI